MQKKEKNSNNREIKEFNEDTAEQPFDGKIISIRDSPSEKQNVSGLNISLSVSLEENCSRDGTRCEREVTPNEKRSLPPPRRHPPWASEFKDSVTRWSARCGGGLKEEEEEEAGREDVQG